MVIVQVSYDPQVVARKEVANLVRCSCLAGLSGRVTNCGPECLVIIQGLLGGQSLPASTL